MLAGCEHVLQHRMTFSSTDRTRWHARFGLAPAPHLHPSKSLLSFLERYVSQRHLNLIIEISAPLSLSRSLHLALLPLLSVAPQARYDDAEVAYMRLFTPAVFDASGRRTPISSVCGSIASVPCADTPARHLVSSASSALPTMQPIDRPPDRQAQEL
ncbi:hypothetical protein C8J57DRAFT_1721330 [Mycena rebaudengoi]|nr:hypothetical protein C8J57DRAFT_1721330 [Mycena rebaudengoi]